MNKGKIIGIGTLSLLLLVLANYLLFNIVLTKKVDLVDVYVANKDIYPRSELTNEDIRVIKIPKAYLDDKTIQKKEDIIGKYTEILGYIPQGSMFFKGMLYEKSTLPDYPSLLLKESQVSFAIQSDVMKSSGNTLTVGQKVDLYVTIPRKDGPPIVDCLIKAIRITGIKDRNGLDVTHLKSTKIPYVVVIAVNDQEIEYLKIAAKIGTVDLYGVNATYQDDQECLFQIDSNVLKYLK